MANSTNKKPAAKSAAKPKVEPKVEEPVVPAVEVEEPIVEEAKEIVETTEPKVEEPVVEEEVKEEVVEAPKAPEKKEEVESDIYIHNVLGTENSKWEVRRKTANGYKVLGKYSYEKAKHYASLFGPVVEA